MRRNGLVVALAIALALEAIGALMWLRRRQQAQLQAVPARTTQDGTVVVPVVAPGSRAAVQVPVAVAVAAGRPTEADPAIASEADPAIATVASDAGPATPGPDGSGPDGWTIKAKEGSGLYHTPSSPSWERMHADAWFATAEAAEAAGFRRWDWRRNGS
jgi:hypothetical protein